MRKRAWAQIVILLIGIVLLLLSFLIKRNENGNNNINVVFLSIGCSIISVVIINYIEYQAALPERNIIRDVNTWGLISIYKTRSKMNEDANKLLETAKEFDLAAFGAKGLINFKGELIKLRLKQGMVMRILIPKNKSSFIKQREKDENVKQGEIAKTIDDLSIWVKTTKNELNLDETFLSIKQYSSLPIESIMRIDSDLFVGPFMVKKVSQLTIAYRYHKGGEGYDYYYKYFNDIWNDNKIATSI